MIYSLSFSYSSNYICTNKLYNSLSLILTNMYIFAIFNHDSSFDIFII